jgi:3',5'-cyclic AMP phosphodiesterase CpdA
MRRRILVGLLPVLFVLHAANSQTPVPQQFAPVRFAVIGDMGTGGKGQYEIAQQMVAAKKNFPFTFVIMVGDNIYGRSSSGDFARKFSQPYKTLLDGGVKFYASLGNHDNPNERFYEPYNMNGSNYYTFRRENVRFFALDSTYLDPKQAAWLEKELKNAGDTDWKVCFFHHPLYSSGKAHGPSVDLRMHLEPLFTKYHVDVVFSGHEHFYERIKPQQGIYYFIEGSSGQLRRNNLKKTSITAKGFDSDNTFMLVEFAGGEMHFQTLTRTGELIDSGTINREANKTGAPARQSSSGLLN